MKTGELRRNGLLESDEATLTEHFIRYGNVLTHVSIVTDPLTLTEPFVRSQAFNLTLPEGQTWLYPCEYVDELADRPRGDVPNYLPGKNPFLNEYANKLHIPAQAVLGGAASMYPDFRADMKKGVFPALPNPPIAPPPAPPTGDLDVVLVQGNVYLIAGAGGNIAVQIRRAGRPHGRYRERQIQR